MKLTSFFIRHPVVAIVLNVMIVVVGCLCLKSVALREYPTVNLPVFMVSAFYPNASPELVESAVTDILEEEFSGVEGLKNMSSTSKYGASNIKLTFNDGFAINQALNSLREALSLVRTKLPQEVKEPKIQRKLENSGPPFIAISLASSEYSFAELTHYANLYLRNSFRKLPGVSSVEVWGQPYVMQVELIPERLHEFGQDAKQVYQALERNNISLPVGKYQDKVPATLDLSLNSEDDFSNIIIGEHAGEPVYLHSVAKINLTNNASSTRIRLNQEPGLALAVHLASDANPIEVSKLVNKELKKIKDNLPEHIKINLELDKSNIVKSSLSNIKHSVIEAIVLVLIIVFLFLRNVSVTLVPLVTIPISLIGSLIFVNSLGFSINTLTLLAMVLAIGLVVDDAIVVIENIMRYIEKGMTPLEAALKGAKEIGFPVVAMTLTLASVYAPIAFIQGAIGQLFVEFAVVLAGSVIISGIVALTLSPVMCSYLVKSQDKRVLPQVDILLDKVQYSYNFILQKVLIYKKFIALVVGLILLGIGLLNYVLKSEMAPKEDRGLVGIYLPIVPNMDVDTFEQKVMEIEASIGQIPEAKNSFSFLGSWGASIIYPLKPHVERKRTAAQIVESLREKTQNIPSMDAWPWSWDSGLPGIGEDTGSTVSLAVSTTDSYKSLFDKVDTAKKVLESDGYFQSVMNNLKLDSQAYKVNLDTNLMVKLGLDVYQIAKIIEIFFSGDKSLFFVKDGFRYPILIKGVDKPWSLDSIYASRINGDVVSLGAVANLEDTIEAKVLRHYNQMRTAFLSGTITKEQTIHESMEHMKKIAQPLFDSNVTTQWIGTAQTYLESSSTMSGLFIMALIFIYAILAVQFESFVDPLIILLTVPLACFGAMLTTYLFGGTFNIYTQIGLVTLVGLISKHGILMVEFANQLHNQGKKIEDAIKESASIRLRPILMTTGAMVLGSCPLIFANGAGAEARHAIGYVLVGGLIIGTIFTLFILPVVYKTIKSFQTTKLLAEL